MNKGRFHSPKLQGPAINERIKSKSVRVISEKGEMLGVYNIQEAVKLAFEQGLDLVEVLPNSLMYLMVEETEDQDFFLKYQWNCKVGLEVCNRIFVMV